MRRKPKIDPDVRALIVVRDVLAEVIDDYWAATHGEVTINTENFERARKLAETAQRLLAERITERLHGRPPC